MSRRILAMLLTLCMLIVLSCGCARSESKTNSQAESKASTSAENASQYPITKEKITVKAMVVPGTGYANNDNKKILWDCLEKLTNIHLDVVTVEKEQQSVYLASGDWPDFFLTPLNSTEVNSYGVEGKMFANYNDYLQYMPNLAACFKKYPTTKKVVTNTDGTVYQLPRVAISSTSVATHPLYRADVLNELGLKAPKTTDEFHDVLKAVYKAKGKAPLVASMADIGYEYFLFGAFGEATDTDFDSIDGKTAVYNRISEQYKHYLEYVSQLYSEGLLHQEFLTLKDTTIDAMAEEGTAVFTNRLATATAKNFKSGKVEIGTLAPFTSQYSSKQKIIGYPYYNISGYAINKKSKYIKEICQLLDIAFAKEEVAEGTGLNGEAFIYGPEGVTWEYKDKEKTSFDFIIPQNSDVVGTSYIFKYVVWNNTGLFDNMMVTAAEGNGRARQLGFRENVIPYAYERFPSNYMSFTSNEQSVVDAKYTDISKYVTEMRGKFITGVKNVKTDWDEYVAAVNKMGIKEVLAAYQTAYDRWNKL